MHTSVKDRVDICKHSMDLVVANLTWLNFQVNFSMVPNLVKDSSLKSWYAKFCNFIRRHHKSRPGKHGCHFLNHFCSDFKFRSNSWCTPCVLGGCIAHVWTMFWGSTPSKFQCKKIQVYFMYTQFSNLVKK
jgi:hypothetical protein